MSDYSFPKSERLTNKKKFDLLFEEGKVVKGFPLKLIYIIGGEGEETQFAFTVPKRAFKKAVDRNLLKRRMKEAYRLNRQSFVDAIHIENKSIFGIFIYINRSSTGYSDIEKGMKKILGKDFSHGA